MTRRLVTHAGFSIVELMVAITLGGILMGGAISLFVTNKETYNVTTDLSRLQESARFALQMIVSDIRMAGFFGCHNDMSNITNPLVTTAGQLWDTTSPIEGFNNGGASWSPSTFGIPIGIRPGTDAITLRYMAPDFNDHLVETASTSVITVPMAAAGDDFIDDAPAGIADCGGAEIFQIDSTNADDINVNGTLGRAYQGYDDVDDASSVVAPLMGVRYHVEDNAVNIPILHRTTIAGGLGQLDQELFEGVENLQFLYGVDQNGDGVPDLYANAGDATLDSVNEWRTVVSVRIGLLMRSTAPIGQAETYTLPDLLDVNLGTFTDSFRRRVFTTTAAVRNI